MLKCDRFLGCFGNCEETISTGIIPTETAVYSFEFWFNKVLHKKDIEVIENEEIKLPNIFTPAMLHCVKVLTENGAKLENISFKIHTQCL